QVPYPRQPARESAPHAGRQRALERVETMDEAAATFLRPHADVLGIREEALASQPRVEVDDAVQRAAAVVRDEHDVAVVARKLAQRGDRTVEDAVDVGDAALRTALLPLRPCEVVDVIGGHEDGEEELRLEPLHEPGDRLA